MVRVALIIAPDNFRDEEYLEPKKVFEDSGFDVLTASITARACHGMFGAKVLPDTMVGDIDEEEVDAVIIVGGKGSPVLSQSNSVIELLRDAHSKGKVVGAICYGGISLARSGLVKGKTISAFKDSFSDPIFQENGVFFASEGVTVLADLRIVTGQGPEFARKFGEAIRDILLE